MISANLKKKNISGRRTAVTRNISSMVKKGPLFEDSTLPYLVTPAIDGVNLVEWGASAKSEIEDLLLQYGAVLFRGFDITSVGQFHEFVKLTSDGGLLEYMDRTTPRTSEIEGIYSSTVYPKELTIKPHNEGTYWKKWAQKLYFYCQVSADSGGETPISDVNKVFERIDPDIRSKFIDKKFMLARNFNDGFGLPWQEVFQTTDKQDVENYCNENDINFEWKSGDRLRTTQIRSAVKIHPVSGKPLWFNHAAFFHYTSLEDDLRENLITELGLESLPYNTFYGDGSEIEEDVVEHIRQCYAAEQTMFSWQSGDLMIIDNMAVSHARQPFTGDRTVLVSMTDAIDGCDWIEGK